MKAGRFKAGSPPRAAKPQQEPESESRGGSVGVRLLDVDDADELWKEDDEDEVGTEDEEDVN